LPPCVCVEVFDADRHFSNRPAGNPATSPATDTTHGAAHAPVHSGPARDWLARECQAPGRACPARGHDGSRAAAVASRGGSHRRPRRPGRRTVRGASASASPAAAAAHGQCNRPSEKETEDGDSSWTGRRVVRVVTGEAPALQHQLVSPGRVAWHAMASTMDGCRGARAVPSGATGWGTASRGSMAGGCPGRGR